MDRPATLPTRSRLGAFESYDATMSLFDGRAPSRRSQGDAGSPVRKPGIKELGDALAKGDRGKADTVSDVSLLTDDADVTGRWSCSGPLQANPRVSHASRVDLVRDGAGRVSGFAGAIIPRIGFLEKIHQGVRLLDYLVGRERLDHRLQVGDHVPRDDEEAPHIGPNRLVLLAREPNSRPAWTRGAFAQVELLGTVTMSLFPS